MTRSSVCLLLVAASCVLFFGCDDTYVPPEQPAARVTTPPPPATAAPTPPPPAAPPAEPGPAVAQSEPGADPESTAQMPDDPEPEQETITVDQPDRAGPTMTVDEARAKIEEMGGRVADDESGNPASVFLNRTTTNDQQLSVLQYLSGVQVLNLTGTRITDAGLKHVHDQTDLKRIYAAHTDITDEGVRQLNEALPDCQVYR